MARKSFEPIIDVKDDGLIIDDVGPWALEKYKLLGFYCDIFTGSMHNKWDNLVYIDLFSGSGYAKIRETNKIVRTSPLVSLSLSQRFTKYIFCDLEKVLISSLEVRVKRDFNWANRDFIIGDCNLKIANIIKAIPQYSKVNTVLTFCFVDPFAINNLHFSTIEKLAMLAMDFLILIPTGMDAKRNFKYFLDKRNQKIDNFLNDPNWRKTFIDSYNQTNSGFVKFLSDEYDKKMMQMGYLKPEAKQQIRSTVKNLPLYHLAFYSKNAKGNSFWNEVKKYSSGQGDLFL